MTSSPAGDAWYLRADDYWVGPEEDSEHPVRQGDLFGPVTVGEHEWFAVQVVHPTCELGKRSVRQIQVVRVRLLDSLADEHQRARVAAGYQEIDSQIRPAFAHTFFLSPAADPFDAPMFSNLREVGVVDRELLTGDRRIATLTHDARVSFIRRKIYFRYRLLLPFDEVRRLEANRIAAARVHRPQAALGGRQPNVKAYPVMRAGSVGRDDAVSAWPAHQARLTAHAREREPATAPEH